MASTQTGTGVREDGRTARSARTRRAIVDALRALHHDGDLRPTAPRVAERAGVSLRTVWQHFEDLESLMAAAGERDAEIAGRFVEPIDPSAPRDARIAALVDQRVAMYEHMAPVWRAARVQEPFSAQLRDNRDRLLAGGRSQLETVFASELAAHAGGARTALLAALQAATNWSTWEHLRNELKLSHSDSRQALITLVSKLTSDG